MKCFFIVNPPGQLYLVWLELLKNNEDWGVWRNKHVTAVQVYIDGFKNRLTAQQICDKKYEINSCASSLEWVSRTFSSNKGNCAPERYKNLRRKNNYQTPSLSASEKRDKNVCKTNDVCREYNGIFDWIAETVYDASDPRIRIALGRSPYV